MATLLDVGNFIKGGTESAGNIVNIGAGLQNIRSNREASERASLLFPYQLSAAENQAKIADINLQREQAKEAQLKRKIPFMSLSEQDPTFQGANLNNEGLLAAKNILGDRIDENGMVSYEDLLWAYDLMGKDAGVRETVTKAQLIGEQNKYANLIAARQEIMAKDPNATGQQVSVDAIGQEQSNANYNKNLGAIDAQLKTVTAKLSALAEAQTMNKRMEAEKTNILPYKIGERQKFIGVNSKTYEGTFQGLDANTKEPIFSNQIEVKEDKNTPTIEDYGDKAYIRETINKMPELYSTAIKNKQAVEMIQKAKELMKGDVTGKSGQIKAFLAPYAEMLGHEVESYSDAQAYSLLTRAMIASHRLDIIGPGPVSEYEQKLMQQLSGGGGTSKSAALELLNYYDQMARNRVSIYNDTRNSLSKKWAGAEGSYQKVDILQNTPIIPPKNDTSLPPQAISQLKEGIQTTFGNGQVWTLQNSKPVRIK